jgi:hypothetical protein
MPLIRLLTGFIGLATLAVAATYGLLALAAIRIWRRRWARQYSQEFRPVALLMPSCSQDPGLYEDLRKLCAQEHPHFHLVFGVLADTDPAVSVAQHLMTEFPDLAIDIVVNPQHHGASQIGRNPPNMLTRAGVWSRLGAMYINEWYMPSVLVGWLLGRGLRIVISSHLQQTQDRQSTLGALIRHELLLMSMQRVLQPWSFRFNVLACSLPLALFGVALTAAEPSLAPAAHALFQFAVGARLALYLTHRLQGSSPILSDLWLLPVSDFLLCWILFRWFFTSRIAPSSATRLSAQTGTGS